MVWDVDPIIVRFGPLALRWYSLFFALGFLAGYFIVRDIFRKERRNVALLDSLLVYLVVATLVGARIGHVLFYEPQRFLARPLDILKIWEGGLASHGGFAAVILALTLFTRRHRELPFLWLADRLAIPVMLTAGLIRIGNLFNSEIIGRPADVPWAVVFPAVDGVPRHPTQVYESLGYLATSLVLYLRYRATGHKPPRGQLLGMAMVLGFGWRFAIEFLKEPQAAFEAQLPLDMGQLLSIPFIVAGLWLLFWSAAQRGRR
jgi:phosphatidylglycerol:prolipoprotein diacylglycerol transferase